MMQHSRKLLTPATLSSFMIGESRAVCDLREIIVRLAPSRVSVLIEGPTGAGKELVATALHELSPRSGHLVPVDVGAISDSMFEDAFFGHETGAFTGASARTEGHLDRAHNGTLFLDEIGRLTPLFQNKLLRATGARSYHRIGSPEMRYSEYRLVCATNRDVWALVESEQFAEDLYYRLSGVRVIVPALANRREDIPLIAQAYLSKIADQFERPLFIAPSAVDVLVAHSWHGNVRELEHVLEAAAALACGGSIDVDQVAAVLERNGTAKRMSSPTAAAYGSRAGLIEMLERAGWNVAAVAHELHRDPSTIFKRMKVLGIRPGLRNGQASLRVDATPPPP
ncbi:MAG: sigma-54-dependent transcriptional regulator [Gemmatimonadaceae bacterium]